MPDPDTDKRRTITLTDHPPVSIREADWPTIAKAEINNARGGNRPSRRWTLVLRQHEDGRMILYGRFITEWDGERDLRAGELLAPGGDVAIAAQQVATAIGCEDQLLVRELLADMPAITLE